MSQKDDPENAIWEYKSLAKKRKRDNSLSGSKKRRSLDKDSQKKTSVTVKNELKKEVIKGEECSSSSANVGARISSGPCISPDGKVSSLQSDSRAETEAQLHEKYCPICQMPFCILVVQSQRWHVAECLDISRDKCEECPDGLQCSSTIPNHYKKFNHTLLAHSRANASDWVVETSPASPPKASASSNLSASPPCSLTPSSQLTNGLSLLRSPGPDDFKKKKGWSSKAQRSVPSSQESKMELSSTPVKETVMNEAGGGEAGEKYLDYEGISYSPLSEVTADSEVRKSLFSQDASENENSISLFDDNFSEDELLADFIHSEPSLRDPTHSDTQLASVTSLAHKSQVAASMLTANAVSPLRNKDASVQLVGNSPESHIKSPQSLVLEHLRETLRSSQSESGCVHTEQHQEPPPPNSTVVHSPDMAPQKGPKLSGHASGLKQTDIGVFFGLKPLEVKKEESRPDTLKNSSGPAFGEKTGGRGQRRGKPSDETPDAEPREPQGRGGGGGWRRRGWGRSGTEGDAPPPRCPFYKKIPGTKFAVDAFRYGDIDGITAYFLTHFHSDHYGGLTKNSRVPIYCNRITGNLVKSKLRVTDDFVHVLPMNARVVVDGVGVILLDANHCPGAAMLLFFLPDGQTVLHTGDFRADPSMESYPELLNCRVQTLYLDTTYCSPEYTFPRQQEVINFATNRAFEWVTLKPRTLVVCGSYSVGKEKVFLALAEVLGSKVCLSRDKYNTMCCLESEHIKKQITTDWKAARVHVLPMMHLNVKKLREHLARFSGQYDQLLAFKPTGWTFSQQVESVEEIQPQTSGNISLYGIPYSEHSSFLELKRFVQWLRPLKIIPTVNVGSWAGRKAMEESFREWLTETPR